MTGEWLVILEMKKIESPAEDSPVKIVLNTFWRHSNKAKGHSWRVLNGALGDALRTCIKAQVKFALDDFQWIGGHLRPSYWMSDGEGVYALAVKELNTSACISFEKWAGRKPFVVDGQRLAVGSEFYCDYLRLWVTSFSDDGKSLNACWYNNPGNHREGAPEKLFKFTIEEFAEGNKARNLLNRKFFSGNSDRDEFQDLQHFNARLQVEPQIAFNEYDRSERKFYLLSLFKKLEKAGLAVVEKQEWNSPPEYIAMEKLAGMKGNNGSDKN